MLFFFPQRYEGSLVAQWDAEAMRALTLAEQEARDLRHDYLGTEHALLAILKDTQMAASFKDLGVDYSDVRSSVEAILR
jgi:ATP-dependent Clp protease ATP-binding subunit ClpC